MKTTNTKILMWIAVGSSLFVPFASAQETINLSAFKGKYNGTVTREGPIAGDSATGTASVKFKVPGSGSSAAIIYAATFSDGMGGTSVYPTSMTLSSKKKVSVTDLLVGAAGANNAKPGDGKWSQRKRTLKIKAMNGEGITLNGTAVSKDLRNRRKLTLTLVSNDGVDTTTFTSRLRGRLPKRS